MENRGAGPEQVPRHTDALERPCQVSEQEGDG